ncbi:hypothetical protein PTSG_12590 [Salpingoeca rosetta]|uniref:Uncharacterized protein n=1 Tax=Salpingoeca rosetta (strain ATCC 50818 / BSB-021) TaxID=946362 RepID=F2UIU0_SALR5|nr:uncharacterized protein PTSG_12590 [Salpingoeca rosetta]EGD77139.1 hypothetical protein PTSG_12590 [Salpingoeca rosetta]|eukprot:XP_004990978.1 hypothetical protein PTSG_12590 [Salpingoeca rosetta]
MAQTISDMYASSSRRGSQQQLLPPSADGGTAAALLSSNTSPTSSPARSRRVSGMAGTGVDGSSRDEPHQRDDALSDVEDDGSDADDNDGAAQEEGGYGSFSATDTVPSATSENFSLGPRDSLHRVSIKMLRKMKDMPAGPAWMGHVDASPRRRSTFAALSSVAASFRRKTTTDADSPNQYILSVVYQGRCTHHLIARERGGQPFSINKRLTRCKSLQSLVYMLALTKDERWPVHLKHPVAPIEDPAEVLVEGRMLFSSNNNDAALYCYNKAIATVQRLMAMFPHKESDYEYELAMAYDLKATVLFSKRKYREAADAAYAATTLAPEWWKPHFSRGLALRQARAFDEAVTDFQRAHDLLPNGDVKAEQCLTAIRDTNTLRDQTHREISKQKMTDIEYVRKNTADNKATRRKQSIVFGPHISDEGIWYILRKRELCAEKRAGTFTATAATTPVMAAAKVQARHAKAARRASDDGIAAVESGNDDGETTSPRERRATGLCTELKQRTVCVGGDTSNDSIADPYAHFQLEAPALPDLFKEHTALEKLFEERLLPTGRWRVPQQQHVSTWTQWYHLRMGQKLPEYELEARHEKTSEMYSWVLTTAHVLRQNIFHDTTPSGSLSMHIVARKPIHEFSAVELCAMLPEMTAINVVQIIPSDRLRGELKCDDVLPGDEDMPAQHLRVSTISGSYSDLLAEDCQHVTKPDLVLFIDSGRQADPQIQADFEDAVDFLTRRKVPIVFTQRFHERHKQVAQWLRDLQVTVAADPKGENPLCSLRAQQEGEESMLVDKHEGQHNGFILFAPT